MRLGRTEWLIFIIDTSWEQVYHFFKFETANEAQIMFYKFYVLLGKSWIVWWNSIWNLSQLRWKAPKEIIFKVFPEGFIQFQFLNYQILVLWVFSSISHVKRLKISLVCNWSMSGAQSCLMKTNILLLMELSWGNSSIQRINNLYIPCSQFSGCNQSHPLILGSVIKRLQIIHNPFPF